MNTSSSKMIRPEIQALRALAVLAVIGFHFHVPGFSGGYLGVDVFLVISGYLITQQITRKIENKNFSVREFYLARIRRILPALMAICFAVMIFGFFFLGTADYEHLARRTWDALFIVANRAYAEGHGYFDITNDQEPLLHTWSLSVEEQFYIVYALFALACVYFAKGTAFFRKIFFIGILVSLTICIRLAVFTRFDAFYFLCGRIWEFLTGGLFAILALPAFSSPKIEKLRTPIFTAGAWALLLLIIPVYQRDLIWPSWRTIIPVFLTAICLAGNYSRPWNRLLSNRPVQRLGDISYSLYLWHWPIWVFGNYLWQPLSASHFFVLLALTFALSFLSWKWVEEPIRHRRDVWTNPRLLGAALTGLAFFSGATKYLIDAHGMPSRLPDYVLHAESFIRQPFPRFECIHQKESEQGEPLPFCTIGNLQKSEFSVLIWGDSHVDQWTSLVDHSLLTQNLKGGVATLGACFIQSVDEKKKKTHEVEIDCWNFNRHVTTWINEHPSVQTIVIGQNWNNYSESPAANDRLIDVLQKLTKTGRKILIIGQTPGAPYDVPHEWVARELTSRQPVSDFSFAPSVSKGYQDFIGKLKKEMPAELANQQITVIDPEPILCKSQSCFGVKNSNAYYIDTNHLSGFAIPGLQPAIDAYFSTKFIDQ